MKKILLFVLTAVIVFLYQGQAREASQNKDAVTWKPKFDDRPVQRRHLSDLEAALPDQPIAPPQGERRILIFSATQRFRHGSIPLGRVALQRLGEATGAYTAVISDDPENFEPEALSKFDGVLLLSPTGDFFMPHPDKRKEFTDQEWQQLEARHKRLVDNLIAFVKDGGGLIGIHAATDACYGHPEYGRTIGGFFASHPWNHNHNVTIVIEEPDHPVISPVFEDKHYFELVEEIYIYRQVPNPRTQNRVLMSLDPKRSDPVNREDAHELDVPVAWVQSVGKGRVFYSSLGHNHHIYTNPLVLRHYLAGIQFALGDIDGPTDPR